MKATTHTLASAKAREKMYRYAEKAEATDQIDTLDHLFSLVDDYGIKLTVSWLDSIKDEENQAFVEALVGIAERYHGMIKMNITV